LSYLLTMQLSKEQGEKMSKGYQGESCPEAIRASLKQGEIISFTELHKRVKQKGSWKDESIWQDMMALVVNLPPARLHWKSATPFLFLHGDGRYELFDSNKHPKTIE
jgi:hypothetical protein